MRKKWKKGIAGVLSVCLLATCVPGVSEIGGLVHTNKRLQAATTDNLVSGECGEKATWSYNKTTKTLTISGSGEMYSYLYLGYVDEVSDPEELLPWFDFRTEIKKIVIGDKITNIGQSAFYECTSLEEVKLGKKVTKIEEYAFCGCRALKTINFTDELEYIGDGAFFECENITKLYIGKKLKIDKYEIDSFSGVKQVKVHAKNKYYTVEGNCLLNKKKTTLLLAWFGSDTTCHVSAKVTSIERDLFENPDMKNFKVSSKNKTYSSQNGLLYSKDKKTLYCCPKGKTGTATISNKTTTMDYNSPFENCAKLTQIVIGKNIKDLEDEFDLSGCDKLKKLTVAAGNKKYVSVNGVVFTKNKKKLLYCVSVKNGTYTIPNGVTSLGRDSFTYCGKIKKLIFSDSVKKGVCGCDEVGEVILGKNYYNSGVLFWIANAGVKSVSVSEKNPYYSSVDGVVYSKDKKTLLACPARKTNYDMPDTVTGIGEDAFGYTYWEDDEEERVCGPLLEQLSISDGVTDLSKVKLSDLGQLKQLHIGKNVEKLPENGGLGSNLEQITIDPENKTYKVEDGMVYTKSDKCLIRCLEKKSGVATVANGTTAIGKMAFENCDNLTEIVIPASVTTIEKNTGGKPKMLERITVDAVNENYKTEDGILYSKKDNCLLECPIKKSGVVTVASGTAVIDETAFKNCDNLTEIVIPASVTTIEKNTDGKPKMLERITVDAANENYKTEDGILYSKKDNCLVECPRKKSGVVTVASGTAIIGPTAFKYCNKITEVVLPSTITKIEAGAFEQMYNKNLIIIRVPKGMKKYYNELLGDEDDYEYAGTSLTIKEIEQ